jgi:hypothetical protein
MYLTAVDMPVLDIESDVALAADVDAVGESLDHRRAIRLVRFVQDGDDILGFFG